MSRSNTARRLRGKRPLSLAEWLRSHGWTFDHSCGEYHGWFHTPRGAWRGCIRFRNGEFIILVHDPPSWFFSGVHADCIHDCGRDWHWVHLNESPRSVRETICGTEAFLFAKVQEGERVA